MKNPYWLRVVCFLFLITAVSLAGCKKKAAAAAPATPAPVAQPAARPPAPTITLRATPAAINRGQATSLQWDAKNASAVSIQPEVGSVQNTGTQSVTPTSSVTYTATATGPGGSASDSARITVNVPAAATPARPAPRPDVKVSMDDLLKQNVQTIYFDYDKAEVRPDQVLRLEADASWLKQQLGLKFTIEGHCDERGSEEYNLGLGDRRANVIKEFLIKQGVDQSIINTVSYGEERPVCMEKTEDCYQRNRRGAFAVKP